MTFAEDKLQTALANILWKLDRNESDDEAGTNSRPAKIDRNDAVISEARETLYELGISGHLEGSEFDPIWNGGGTS